MLSQWNNSYRRCNLDPNVRLSFPEWCKKIGKFLTAGGLFKEENVEPSAREKFDLLPSFWKGMSEAERKIVMTIMSTNQFKYTATALQQLHKECTIAYGQMNDLRVCVIIAQEHPESLAFEPTLMSEEDVSNDIQAVADARDGVASLDSGLDMFQLHPKDEDGKAKLSGNELFDHIIKFRNRNEAAEARDGTFVRVQPNDGLNVELHDDSLECIQPTASELRMGAVMKDSIGVRAKRKCAKRKLNNIGTIVGHSGVVNSEENRKRMKDSLTLAAAMSEINSMEDAEREEKAKEVLRQHNEKAPAAARKLEDRGRNVGPLYQGEIEALLFKVYNKDMSGKGSSKLRKADYVKALEAEMQRSIEKYEEYLAMLGVGTNNVAVNNEVAGAEEDDDDLMVPVDDEEDGEGENITEDEPPIPPLASPDGNANAVQSNAPSRRSQRGAAVNARSFLRGALGLERDPSNDGGVTT